MVEYTTAIITHVKHETRNHADFDILIFPDQLIMVRWRFAPTCCHEMGTFITYATLSSYQHPIYSSKHRSKHKRSKEHIFYNHTQGYTALRLSLFRMSFLMMKVKLTFKNVIDFKTTRKLGPTRFNKNNFCHISYQIQSYIYRFQPSYSNSRQQRKKRFSSVTISLRLYLHSASVLMVLNILSSAFVNGVILLLGLCKWFYKPLPDAAQALTSSRIEVEEVVHGSSWCRGLEIKNTFEY